MDRLDRAFFDRDTVTVARELVGKTLVRVLPDGTPLVCAITETEAYIGRCDRACHAYNYRRTSRTETLFAKPGTAYLYLIYGMHHCLNIVTEGEGEPAAVLIRGLSPLENGDIIAENRFGRKMAELTPYQRKNFLNGPGKSCAGLLLTRRENGLDTLAPHSPLYLCDGPAPQKVEAGPRIGIDYAGEDALLPWRFWRTE